MSNIANILVDTVGNTPHFSGKGRVGRSMIVATEKDGSLKLGGKIGE
jgi:cysteine synthase